jgi:GNAT superfamily N-acetyltransferase
MDIRRATENDAMAIAKVHVRSWQAAYPGLIPQDYLDGLRPEGRLAGWQEILGSTNWPWAGMLVLVDEAGGTETSGAVTSGTVTGGTVTGSGTITGFSHMCPSRDDDLDPATTGEITSIYLAPEAWGGGNGLALIQASIATLVTAGYETACLWALDTNAKARRFYEIGGWTLDGATKIHDWGTFVCTDVRYVLDLKAGRQSVEKKHSRVREVDDR